MSGPRNTRKDAEMGNTEMHALGGFAIIPTWENLCVGGSATTSFLSLPFAYFAGKKMGGIL